MQLLRVARAVCTNPHFWIISIGSSLSLGPIFSIATATCGNPVLSQARIPSCRRRETRLVTAATFTPLIVINRNRMNVASFKQNYWSPQVKMFICCSG